MLKRLIESHQVNHNYHHSVVSITTLGKVGAQLQEMGVEVLVLGMRSTLDILRVLWQLVRLIRAERPDIVQTWMYHANLLGGLAARFAGNRNVVWGVRGTDVPERKYWTRVIMSICSRMSWFLPSAIVCCAESVRTAHAQRGYDPGKMLVIPNGYELTNFNRNPVQSQQLRTTLGFSDADVVVGIVGRFDPLKDYKNFVRAAAMVSAKNPAKFLMIGMGIDSANDVLQGWLAKSGCAHKFVLAGERSDIPECLAAMDIFCLSSSKEGFPNVVCEAMAMGVPCVVTDVGDAAVIVSDTGIVVAPDDSAALAGALQVMIIKGVHDRARLGELARLRIEKHYTIEIASARFETLYKQVTSSCRNQHWAAKRPCRP